VYFILLLRMIAKQEFKNFLDALKNHNIIMIYIYIKIVIESCIIIKRGDQEHRLERTAINILLFRRW